MASVIHGYEYDIFISYRQNDNKYDGWVTAFVHNLTIELEATIKEKVSVYFDIDPRDGLLETHTVDRSLEDKLKCLIFIPIISKTYCDKTAFAWQNEFCAFNRMAREDRFGRDIRLSRGNFASRILPVRIHELDPDDMSLIENELGSSLRSIDFIYKSAGVNRPLRANEDHPQNNLNNTYYRDQINKVANSIAEILFVLKQYATSEAEKETHDRAEKIEESAKAVTVRKTRKTSFTPRNKLWVVLFAVLVVLTVVFKLIFPSGFDKVVSEDQEHAGKRISVTIMPFNNLTNDPDLDYLSVGVQDWVVYCLSFYPEEFNVRPFELVRDVMKNEKLSDLSSITPYTGSSISRRLDAEVFLIGNIFKIGEIIRLNAQLISSESKEIISTFQEEGFANNILYTIDSLSVKIRDRLLISKIDQETYKSEPKKPYRSHFVTSSPEAFRYHIMAKEACLNLDYKTAYKLDSQAISVDSNFVGAMVTFSLENLNLGKFQESIKWMGKAYEKREELPLIQQISLDYQYAALVGTTEEQIKYLSQLQKLEDNNPGYYLLLGYLYVDIFKYDLAIPELEKAQEIFKEIDTEPNDLFYYHYLLEAYNKTGQHKKGEKVLKKAEKYFLKNQQESGIGDNYYKMALIYCDANRYEKAAEYFKKGVSINPGNNGLIGSYAFYLIDYNLNVNEGLELINALIDQDPDNGIFLDTKGWGLYRQNKYDEALEILEQAYQLMPLNAIQVHIDSVKAALVDQ